jgi:hypothetical protein
MTGKEGLTRLDGYVRKEGIQQETRDMGGRERYGEN